MKKFKSTKVKLPKGEQRIGEGVDPKMNNTKRLEEYSKLLKTGNGKRKGKRQ